MKINGNEIRPGNIINHLDTIWQAVKVQAVKPGKGGAFAQVELKNVLDGRKLNARFRATEKIERVRLDQRKYQCLYRDGEAYVFMDSETYDQTNLTTDVIGENHVFLAEGMGVDVELYEGRPIGVALPAQVTLEISEADAVVKGQTATASYKPAVLSNGVRIMVPPFVQAGERIIVDTASRTYVRRAEG